LCVRLVPNALVNGVDDGSHKVTRSRRRCNHLLENS
jgi:hypothetical protein